MCLLLKGQLVFQNWFNKILPKRKQKGKRDPQLSGNLKESLVMPSAKAEKKYCQQGFKRAPWGALSTFLDSLMVLGIKVSNKYSLCA